MTNHSGVLVIHKAAGMTSHDCVAQVRRLFRTKKVGHTGTLDPDVTGVLPICLGQATRIVEYLQELPKTYEVTMRLGSSTTTEDASGEVTRQKPVNASELSLETLEDIRTRFLGEIDQVPPMYSAIKINGKRLYDLAREGIVVERKARKVHIYDLEFHQMKVEGEEVEISFRCRCSKGTYMRTLCVDIGQMLGYPAHMTKLIRTESGPFSLDQAITLEQVEDAVRQDQIGQVLVPVEQALSFLPACEIASDRVKAVLNGLETRLAACEAPEGSLIRLFGEGRFLGLHRVVRGPGGVIAKPEKVFQPEV